MGGVDTNILVYACLTEAPHHDKAKTLLAELAEGNIPWAIPWPCIYEFLRVMTHPSVATVSVSMEVALKSLRPFLDSPSLILLAETDRHREISEALLVRSGVAGNLVYDAHIATLLLEHGVREIITNDDDFRRFEELRVINPFRA